MKQKSADAVLVGVGIAVVVAFFLPFLDVGGLIRASAFDVVVGDGVSLWTRFVLTLLPVGGLWLIVAGATGKNARLAGLAFGAGVYGYLGYQVVEAFFATTGVGLWITLIAAAVALVAALASKKR